MQNLDCRGVLLIDSRRSQPDRCSVSKSQLKLVLKFKFTYLSNNLNISIHRLIEFFNPQPIS
jgi:hypothetical protein